jgi:hypothetical protein
MHIRSLSSVRGEPVEPYERAFPSTLREASGQVASVNKTEGRLLLSLAEASGRTDRKNFDLFD